MIVTTLTIKLIIITVKESLSGPGAVYGELKANQDTLLLIYTYPDTI
jgi:hypothetical protein